MLKSTQGDKMKVIKKQTNSKSCIICGMENNLGLKAQFYELEDKSVASLFTFKFEHQSYPGRVHGGMVASLLDELMGRVLWVDRPNEYAVTTTMNVTYRKPTPYGEQLKARAYLTFSSSFGYSAKGEVYNKDNVLLAEGSAKYMILPIHKTFSDNTTAEEEMCYDILDDVTDIDFPQHNK